MTSCEAVVDVTQSQETELARLQNLVHRMLRHLLSKFPQEQAWSTWLHRTWNGQVRLGTMAYRAEVLQSGGCLLVGIPPGPTPVNQAKLNARVLLVVAASASQESTCTTLPKIMMQEASALNVPLEIECEDADQYALPSSRPCHTQRYIWPELVGKPVAFARALFPGKEIQLATWDSGNVYRPARRDTVRITYDAPSGLIVEPAPHLATITVPVGDANCFGKVDVESTKACIGAPLVAENRWTQFTGTYITDAIDSLRVWYPHATIEAVPANARLSSDLRSDRIRVRFDAQTGRVLGVPFVG